MERNTGTTGTTLERGPQFHIPKLRWSTGTQILCASSPGRLIYFTVEPSIFSIIIVVLSLTYKKICISTHAPSTTHQVAVRFTGHYRTVGPQYGTYFTLPSWHLEFWETFAPLRQSVMFSTAGILHTVQVPAMRTYFVLRRSRCV